LVNILKTKKVKVDWQLYSSFITMDSSLGKDYQITTLPETNIAPENRRSQKDTSIPNSNHPLFMFHVSFREGKYY